MQRWLGRPALLVAVLSLAAGCDRESVPAVDSVATATPQPPDPPPAWTGEWAPEFGELLVVPSDTDNTAIVVYPDAPSAELMGSVRLQLLNGAGEPAVADVTVAGADSLECGGAPVVRLSSGAFGTWTLGVTGAAGVLHADTLEALAPADSARIVASLARVASAATGTEETRFTGLPFTVLRARRFTVGATRIVAAHLVRRVPQEASPLEEHVLVIAERPLQGDSLRLRFSQRSEGTEETAEHFEVLTAVKGARGILLLIARDNVSGTRYEILERDATGSWRLRWTRPLRC